MIALSSPNGVGNWFHQMFIKAEIGQMDDEASGKQFYQLL